MVRAIIGGLVGGLALWLVGFLFWGTPLSALAFGSVPAEVGAAVQLALSQHLGSTGTGSYVIPNPATGAGTALYGQGPVALVHFNSGGFPVIDAGALTSLLLIALVVGVVLALALREIAARAGSATAVRAGLMVALATAFHLRIADAVGGHLPIGYHAYAFVADALGFSAVILIVARWFLPATAAR